MRNDPADLLRTIVELPPVPVVALRVMRLVNSERTNAQELARALSADPALTAKLLKLSNSANAGLGRRVATVHEAVVVLGFKQVRQVAFVTSVINSFNRQRSGGEPLDRDAFWYHNVSVAVAAELLAKQLGTLRPEEAFASGILHDIGQLVLSHALPREFAESRALQVARGVPVREAEIRTTGFAHDDVGRALGTAWRFPPQIVDAIGRHHDLDLSPERDGLAGIVARADALVRYQATCPEILRLAPIPPALAEVEDSCGGWPGIVERSNAFIDSLDCGLKAA